MIVSNPFSRGTWTREGIDYISRGWWVLLVTGIITAVAGGIILTIDWSVDDLATFIGVILIIQGIFRMFSVPVDGAVRAWSVGIGVLEAAVGVAVFVWPGPTLLVVAFVIGWWILFSGLMTIAGSITGRDVIPYWGLMLAFGILETLFAFWLLARPGLTLVAAVLAIGLWALIYGVIEIVLAFEIKHMPARADAAARDLTPVTASSAFDAAASR
jgi:uncharacterized membrane protein HdeD (DUF308 family)